MGCCTYLQEKQNTITLLQDQRNCIIPSQAFWLNLWGIFSGWKDYRSHYWPKLYNMQPRIIFIAVHFWNLWKSYVFTKPSILIVPAQLYQLYICPFLSTVCSQEPFSTFSLCDKQFRASSFWGVAFTVLSLWEIESRPQMKEYPWGEFWKRQEKIGIWK